MRFNMRRYASVTSTIFTSASFAGTNIYQPKLKSTGQSSRAGQKSLTRRYFSRLLLAATLLFAPTLSFAAQMPAVEDFARLPLLKQVRISPGGKYMSAKVANENVYNGLVYKFTDEGPVITNGVAEDEKRWVRKLRWVNEDRLVLSVGFNSIRRGTDTVESRLLSLPAEGGKPIPLFSYNNVIIPVQFEDDIVSWLDHDPEHILIQYRKEPTTRSPHVMRVAVNKRRLHKTAQTLKSGIYDWQADTKGVVRAGRGYKDQGETKPYLIIRKNVEDTWRDISHRIGEGAPDFSIRGFYSDDPNIAYVESTHEHDLGALYEYDIEKDAFGPMIFRSTSSEVGRLYLSPNNGAIRGIGYGAEQESIIWLDSAIKAEIKAIENIFPDKSVTLIRESIDQKFAVYDISGALDPGRYYIFDRENPRLSALPPQYPELEQHTLSPVIAQQYQARDGLQIKAYVTLPTGAASLDAVKNAPFVILPHGGPHARDFLQFDYWAQFLASRGYGVLQMNFRGSSGAGQTFREAGQKQWGQAMQDDITDGAQWLVQQGYADPDRLAIMGGSYGGYAALMGAVKTPDLYQCAISFAGISDLPAVVRRSREYIGGKAAANYIGRLWQDRQYLKENSPAQRADEVKVPVLLIHGKDDRIVDVNQSKKMRRALKAANKTVEYIELDRGDHYLSLYKNRLKFLTQTERFLKTCLN